MRKDKEQAIRLRRSGLSYNEISKKLGIPKSTLSFWLSDLEISKKAKIRIASRVYTGSVAGLIKRNKNQTFLAKERADKIRNTAKLETKELMKNKLFLAGISLYWAEGYKKGAQGSKWKAVDFANSDPEMIRMMMRFFRNICNVGDEKIKMQIIAHENVDIDETVQFWSKLTKIPNNQFIKTYCSASSLSKNKRQGSNLTHGTVHIRINSVELFFRIIGWIDGLKLNI
ncbi:MAG: helix-turn-helix domain-containing protein [Candidatus Moraniibacteriota bacterium]